MNQRYMLSLVVGLCLAGAIEAQPSSRTPVDQLGDPLPIGAVGRLGTLRFKHEPAVNTVISTVAFSPDGKKIVSIGGRGNVTLRLWDDATGQQIPGPWSTNDKPYSAVAFSPDSAVLAAATGQQPGGRGVNPIIVLWDLATAKPLQTLPASGESGNGIQALVFVDEGKTLIAAGDGVVNWWDIAQGAKKRSWRPFGEVKQPAKAAKGNAAATKTFYNCALSPDGKFLTVDATSGRQGAFFDGVQVQFFVDANNSGPEMVGFDLATGKVTWQTTGKPNPQNQLPAESRFTFSADGKAVAVATGSEQVAVRNPANGKLVAMAQMPKTNNDLRNLTAYDQELLFLRLNDQRFGGVRSNANGALALSADGTTMAICGNGGQVVLWNKEAPEAMRFIGRAGATADPSTSMMAMVAPKSVSVQAMNSGPAASAVAFSPDGKRLAVATGSILKVHDLATLKELTALDGHERAVDFIAFSQDGKRLLTGSSPLSLDSSSSWSWETSTWKTASSISHVPGGLPEIGVVSPDLTRFVGVGANNRFGVYDLKNGKLLTVLSVPSNQNPRARIFFSPDSKYVVLLGLDDQGKNDQRLYAMSSGKLLCVLPNLAAPVEVLRPVAFSDDGRLVALFSRDDGLIHTFNIATGKLLHKMGTPSPLPGRIYPSNLAFTSDGRLLASWNLSDNVVRIWDMATGKQRLLFPPDGQLHNRLHLAWSPDSRTLAMGDRTIKLWEMATLKVRHEFTGHEGDIRALAFSPDGRHLVSGSTDTTALVWDTWVGDVASR